MHLEPGSYIITEKKSIIRLAGQKLNVPEERLAAHPDFMLVVAQGELSLGIEKIRDINFFLHMTPGMAKHKIVVIDNFHFATTEAQNAFLKTFEEPPEYVYIFLVTPYIDRLPKTIVSRAIVIEGSKLSAQGGSALGGKNQKLVKLIGLGVAQRLLWLEKETKPLKNIALKQWLMKVIDEFLIEGIELLKSGDISVQTIEELKEIKWKVEQGFPLPRLLLEGFLVQL